MPKENYVYRPRLCIHGNNESACQQCFAEYQSWLDKQTCSCYCHDDEGDCRLDDDLLRACCQDSPYYPN